MALLAIFCGLVIPALFIYYVTKDIIAISRREDRERRQREKEKTNNKKK